MLVFASDDELVVRGRESEVGEEGVERVTVPA
jgi:hypothetical protein